jgi:hypothetical protein
MHQAFEALAANRGNPRTAPQDLPPISTSPVPVEPAAPGQGLSSPVLVEQWRQEIQARRAEPSDETSVLELVRHALARGDQAARSEVEQYLRKIVLAWLRCHPSREAACSFQGEEHYVALAFERFWHVVVQGQVTCETQSSVLVCLRASLHGAILETLRDSSRAAAVSSPRPDVEDCPDRSEIWDRLQALLPNRREQRLAYLLYHCGLGPREIVRFCPQEWSDVQEISRLRHTILERLLNHANLLGSWLSDWEPL